MRIFSPRGTDQIEDTVGRLRGLGDAVGEFGKGFGFSDADTDWYPRPLPNFGSHHLAKVG